MAVPFDERNRQGKALTAWKAQQHKWNAIESALAKQVGKKPDETLPATVQSYRRKQEELGMIEASVPAEVKNGISAWEMNLRAGSGGVRYVQVGSSYPYPLYCPIRDSESVKPDNHILMRVIPDSLHFGPHEKPVTEGGYFKLKQAEFKKYVKKKFAHFVANAQPMAVVGVPPPTSKSPLKEDAGVESVVFIPFQGVAGEKPSDAATPRHATPSTTTVEQVDARQAPSRPLSAISTKSGDGLAGQEGPMLMFSAAHLSFTAPPNVAVHATLRVANIGTTAVFYSWLPLPRESFLDDRKRRSDATDGGDHGFSSARDGNGAEEHFFRLSAPNDGVFVPDDESCFTFMFRSSYPGAFVQQYELLTVPAGKERIIVQLRGVVLRGDSDALGVQALEKAQADRAPRLDARNLFTEMLTKPIENPLEMAHMRMLLAERNQEKAVVVNQEAELQRERERRWTAANALLGLPFNEAVYEKIHLLHHRYTSLMRDINPPTNHPPVTPSATAPGFDDAAPGSAAHSRSVTPATASQRQSAATPSSPIVDGGPGLDSEESLQEWSGSIRSFLEDLTTVRDVQCRTSFLQALNVLITAASVSDDKRLPLAALLRRSAAKRAWEEGIDDIAGASATARDIVEGRGTLKNVGGKDAKDKGKGQNKKAAPQGPKGEKGAGAPAGERSVEENAEAKAEYDDLFFNLARRAVGDLVQNMLTLEENQKSTIQVMCDRDTEVMLAWRMEDVRRRAVEHEPDLESTLEQNTKGKKK